MVVDPITNQSQGRSSEAFTPRQDPLLPAASNILFPEPVCRSSDVWAGVGDFPHPPPVEWTVRCAVLLALRMGHFVLRALRELHL